MEYIELGKICSIKTGKLDANASSTTGVYPFFTCSKEPLKIDSYSYDCECILVAGNGDLNVKYYNGKFDAYQRTYIIEVQDKSKYDTKFIYLLINSKIEELRNASIGGVIKYIKLSNLTNINVPKLSIKEQNLIVNKMFNMSKIIEIKNKQISKLNELIKSQFVEMFENSESVVEKLGNVCTKITDGTHKTPNYIREGITFISAKNIVNERLNFSDVKYISCEEYKEIQNRCNTEKGDILLSKSGSLGVPVVLDTNIPVGLFESLAVIKYDRNKLNGMFLCEQLKSEKVQKQFKSESKGISIKHLHLNVLKNIDIFIPSLELQNKFANIVKQIDKQKFEFEKSLKKLEEMQSALMQEYFG